MRLRTRAAMTFPRFQSPQHTHRHALPPVAGRSRPAGLHALRLCAIGATTLGLALAPVGCANKSSGTGTREKPSTRDQSQNEARAKSLMSSAEQAIRDGDIDRALAEFERAIEINPTLTAAHLGMADIYRMRQDYTRAEARYAQAAKLEPKNFDAQYFHGLMLHLLDRLPEAIQAYLRALTVKPNDFKANLNVATAYYQLDENAQALPYARRAVELNPEDGPARFNLGAVYAALDRHSDAVREYQQAAELMKLTPALLLNLADSLGKLQRFEEMANALTQAVKDEPSAIALERLGFARFKMGRFAEAKQSFEQSVKLDGTHYPALNGVGVCYLNDWVNSKRSDQKAKETGLSALRRSLQINQDQPQVLELVTRYGR